MRKKMRLLFIGESWLGSSARAMCEALATGGRFELADLNEDLFRPRARSLMIRLANRVLNPKYQAELERAVLSAIGNARPDFVVVYKGNLVTAKLVRSIQAQGVLAVNIFPDCSPHAHGASVRRALGEYDLVISTKPYHPTVWNSVYGYRNRCMFVPHGYDPDVHLWEEPWDSGAPIDVVMAASWRPQYEVLMRQLAKLLGGRGISVAVAGSGWQRRSAGFPQDWEFPGEVTGRAYGEFLRRGKIAIAPVHTEMTVGGKRQPGDEDSTRTYELAAAGVFFTHRRTEYVKTVYREGQECLLWDSAEELSGQIIEYLPQGGLRARIAAAAHNRAVPAYSLRERAQSVCIIIEDLLVKL